MRRRFTTQAWEVENLMGRTILGSWSISRQRLLLAKRMALGLNIPRMHCNKCYPWTARRANRIPVPVNSLFPKPRNPASNLISQTLCGEEVSLIQTLRQRQTFMSSLPSPWKMSPHTSYKSDMPFGKCPKPSLEAQKRGVYRNKKKGVCRSTK